MTPTTHSRRQLAQYVPYTATIALVFTAALFTACGRTADAKAAPTIDTTVPVRVTSLSTATAAGPSAIAVTGTLAGKEEVALAFKVGGVISRVLVDPGQVVRAGQLLAELRPTEIAAQVASAQEARRKAERDLARVTRLYADSVTTLEQLQDARTALEVATNTQRVAQFNAEYASIRAPGDGIVLSRAGEPGEVVEPGRSVLTVRRNSRGMVVRVGLPDRDALRVQVGDTARVTFDALPGQQFMARVTQRAVSATAGTGDYGVEVTLTDAGNALPSGLVARVELHARGQQAASQVGRVLVPLDALVDADADSAAVFVLRPDRSSVSRRPIRLSDVAEALRTAEVTVVSGLTGTETVVTVGMSRLIDGSRVRVITTPDQRSTTDAPRARIVP